MPVLNTKIVARTGSFVVFEHLGIYVRGLALYFVLYLPPKGDKPMSQMTEFRGQVVLLAYVYVAALDRNCLVVRVRQQHVDFAARPGSRTTPHCTGCVHEQAGEAGLPAGGARAR